MKPILYLLTLVTVFFCFVLNSRLQQREADLAAAREKIKATEEERVPRSDLDSTQGELLDAAKKILALEDELKKAQGQVATLSNRVTFMESQPNAPRLPKPRPVTKAGLMKGGFRIMEENVVYLPDSQYRLGEDLFVTSPQGMMMSDKEQTVFGGDLLLQTPQGTIQGDDAVLEINGDSAILTAKQVKVALRKTADAGSLGQPAGK